MPSRFVMPFPLCAGPVTAPDYGRIYDRALVAAVQRIGTRPAYRRAMAKGDPDLTPTLT